MKLFRAKMKIHALLLLSLLAGGTAVALEQPDYKVLQTNKNYEIRAYKPFNVAEVDVDGNLKNAGNRAFRLLARYIFGDNEPGEKMNMTAPVTSEPINGSAHEGDDEYTYAFVMERKYTMDSLPQPNDPRVRFSEKPARILAVRRYSGTWSEENYQQNVNALIEALGTDGFEVKGTPIFARYDAPFKPWFMRRNEIMIEIEWENPDQ